MSRHTPFTSLLVANRGEIALRVMKSAREAGLKCIAVYTDADTDAPHVAFADQAVNIGTGPVGDSYLSIEKILKAAVDSGAGAIHPGYGFLSESAVFATACTEAGLIFVGPSAEAIQLMGNKAEAKRQMIAAGVPCVPGYEGADQSPAVLQAEADKIGYPVMIKAAAGGGGRGMRLVEAPDTFVNALQLAQAEAEAAFGSGEMILEKAVQNPRHVEVQVFADREGNTIHLGERDCSVQRRHQKVVEEAPCPVMSDDLREQMGAAAVKAAQSIGYEGAGTVEFLLDAEGAFYFLEMNTRLQVEHPVTELVTGVDLVDMQLKIASGAPLGMDQSDVELKGHAIEVRLYAEDPVNDFLPATGPVELWAAPTGDQIRVDSGIETGMEVSPFYDPMLAKVIAHGATREEARQNLVRALSGTTLFGPENNRDFLIDVLEKPTFISGSATTAFIAEEYADGVGAEFNLSPQDVALAGAVLNRALQSEAEKSAVSVAEELKGWGSPGKLNSRMTLASGNNEFHVLITQTAADRMTVRLADSVATVELTDHGCRLDGARIAVNATYYSGRHVFLSTDERTLKLAHKKAARAGEGADSGGSITAPMHGNLLEVFVSEGDQVAKGARLAVLEAMKMQHEVLAGAAGTIKSILVQGGTQVRAGDVLIELEEKREAD